MQCNRFWRHKFVIFSFWLTFLTKDLILFIPIPYVLNIIKSQNSSGQLCDISSIDQKIIKCQSVFLDFDDAQNSNRICFWFAQHYFIDFSLHVNKISPLNLVGICFKVFLSPLFHYVMSFRFDSNDDKTNSNIIMQQISDVSSYI